MTFQAFLSGVGGAKVQVYLYKHEVKGKKHILVEVGFFWKAEC